MRLISFDIDGTLFFGSPPGHITSDVVRKAKELGLLVGSASDRTISNQINLWAEHNIEVDFVSLKHRLAEVKERFGATRCLHIGNSEMDRLLAKEAGFDFLAVEEIPNDGSYHWML